MWGQQKNKCKYSDLELIRLIVKSGKTHYFEVLYDRYAHFVYNKCFWFVNQEEEAKDLTQEIFIKIYLNLTKFKGTSKLSTWIYAITVHTSINYVNQIRSKKAQISLNDYVDSKFLTDAYDITEPSDAELLEINYKKLQQILDKLPLEDKMLLLMKYQDNLSVNQIVEILNIKESAVKMRLLRAKKKVMELHAKFASVITKVKEVKQFNL